MTVENGLARTRRERRQLAREQKRKAQRSAPGVSSAVPAWYWAIPCLAAFLAYLRTVSFDFINDDYAEISLISGFWREISHPLHAFTRYYRPTFSAFMFCVHEVAGLDPSVWHFSSMLLHTVATFSVFWLMFVLLQQQLAASVAAFVFAIHPAHIESVCWILGNDDLMCAALFAALAVCLLRFLRTSSRKYGWISWAAWLLAVCSKETAVALFLVFFLLALRELGSDVARRFRRAVGISVPYAGAIVLYLTARAAVLHGAVIGNAGIDRSRTWNALMYSLPGICLSYLRKLVWPADLRFYYRVELSAAATPSTWLAILLLIGIFLCLAWLSRKETLVGIATALIVLPLIPVLYGTLFFSLRELTADRYLYLPSIGICLLLGIVVKSAASWSPRTRATLRVSGCAVAAAFLWLLFTQQGIYADDVHLDLRTLEIYPNEVGVMRGLGLGYLANGRMDLSIATYQRVLKLVPGDPTATLGLRLAAVSGFNPGNFPLGSTESRAAARMRLRQLSDQTRWISLARQCCDSESRLAFGPWSEMPDGDHARVIDIPAACRILAADDSAIPMHKIPICPECKTSFREFGREGLLVTFVMDCVDKHDHAPEPIERTAQNTGSALTEREMQRAKEAIVRIELWEIAETLASRVDVHPSDLSEMLAGRSEMDSALHTLIAKELETWSDPSHVSYS